MARSWTLACLVALFYLVVLSTSSAHIHGRDAGGASTRIHLDKIVVARDGDVRMSAWPGELKRSGEWVSVSWSGASAGWGDWVGVYSPADADVTVTAPIKYKYADEFKDGYGKLWFRLTNMRADYIFHYFSGGIKKPTLIASSNRVTFANYNEPLQGRLMLTGVPHEMRVMWTTYNTTSPLVKFGTSPGQYVSSVRGSTTTYTRDQMCGAPANTEGWRDPGLFHSAILSNLSPDTRYYYVYGDPAYGFSEEASFMSAPHPGAASRTLNIFAYGDMGKTTQDDSLEHWNNEKASINTTRLMMKDMQAIYMDLAIHIGDISYAVGYGAQWDEFHDQVSAISTRLPYMTCIGNHERDFPNSGSRFNGTDSGGECGVAYEVRYPMPTPARDQPWYSFDYGSVHFTFMSSEHNFTIGGTQWQWIEADLRSVDRTKTPWIIFSGHRPMYIDSNYDKGDSADQPVARELRSNLEDLLFKYRVDLAFWGHHHSYQRSCPVFNGTCMPEGQATTHVVIGMAGYRLSTDIPLTMPSWARVVDVSENGYTRLSVTPSRLEMTFISDVDARSKDHFVLTK